MNNNNVVLVMGQPNTGKSTSLMFFDKPEEIVYLNTDNKDLPFRPKFKVDRKILKPEDAIVCMQQLEELDDVTGAVLDTLTFLMQQFEQAYVRNSPNGRSAWGEYAAFYHNALNTIKASKKDYAILVHEDTNYDEQSMTYKSQIPVKGSVGKLGVEADFTTILAARKVSIKALEGVENDLLHITDEEREDGQKYVFLTRPFKGDGDKVRSPMKLWSRNELYIDNNIQYVFKRLHEYYNN